jgi:hypothetical protein
MEDALAAMEVDLDPGEVDRLEELYVPHALSH